jgi:hypothetical protein
MPVFLYACIPILKYFVKKKTRELCRKWNWIQPNGVLKDMICRGLLLRLNAQGLNDGGAAKGCEYV